MKFYQLLNILGDEAVFESSLLLCGNVNPKDISRQLSRWTKSGRIHQLRRGLYILANPYRKREPHAFKAANLMVRGSYVSLHSALSYYGMIPEFVPNVTCVTTQRPNTWDTVLGRFEFSHIKTPLFHSYQLHDLGSDQKAFIASPEKALLDLLYLVPESHKKPFLQELRLHFTDHFHLNRFLKLSKNSKSPKLIQAGQFIQQIYKQEQMEYNTN